MTHVEADEAIIVEEFVGLYRSFLASESRRTARAVDDAFVRYCRLIGYERAYQLKVQALRIVRATP